MRTHKSGKFQGQQESLTVFISMKEGGLKDCGTTSEEYE